MFRGRRAIMGVTGGRTVLALRRDTRIFQDLTTADIVSQVLQAWRDAPLPGTELVVVSPHALAPYWRINTATISTSETPVKLIYTRTGICLQ